MNKKIYIKITGDFHHKEIVLKKILDFKKTYPSQISFEVSDCPGCFIWNGGHAIGRKQISAEDYIKHIQYFNGFNINYSVIFNNNAILPHNLEDEECNRILNFLNNTPNNSVTIASRLLYNYIKNNYPNIKMNCSAVFLIKTLKDLEETIENYNYDKIILAADFSKNFQELEKIKDKDKIELIIDELCLLNCPYKDYHYRLTSDFFIDKDEEECDLRCIFKINGISHSFEQTCALSYEELKKCYCLGFRNFKLTHREYPDNEFEEWLEKYLNYFNILLEEI